MLRPHHHIRYYFFLFATLGLVSPYLGWWLGAVLPATSIKYALASFYATIIIIPAIWGHAAFSGRHPGQWLSHGTLAAALFALGLSQIDHATSLGVVCFLVLAFGVFFNPLLPLLEAMAYSQTSNQEEYSRIRLFGSLGFLSCSSLVGGMFLMTHPTSFPWVVALLMVLTWISSWPYTHVPLPPSSLTRPNIAAMLADPGTSTVTVAQSLLSLWPLWITTAMTQAAFVCYYAFFALHMKSLGVSGGWIGAWIGLATMAEIVAFWNIAWFFKKASPWTLIVLASLVSALRWWVLGHATPSWWWLVSLVQLTHAVGFSVFHAACLNIIDRKIPSDHMGAAQGFYNAVGYGVGGVLGVLLSGALWVSQGGQAVFDVATVISLSTAAFASIVRRQALNKPSLTP